MVSFYMIDSITRAFKIGVVSTIIAALIVIIVPFLIDCKLICFIGATLFLQTIITPVLKRWIPNKRISPSGKAVFITGCDTGFGHLLAHRLHDLGFVVFAGCLFPDANGAEKLRNIESARMHVVKLDVTNEASIWKAAAYVKENLSNNKLWAVVNNAGILETGPLHWANMDAVEKVFEVNTFGPIRVTQAFLPMLRDVKGRVINVASSAGRVKIAGCVPYCMSKSAVILFTEGLRLEMRKWGIQVATIEPVMYKTSFIENERIRKQIRTAWEKAPESTKDSYDSNYIDRYTEKYLELLKSYSNQKPSEVAAVMEESIMVEYPENSYFVGPLYHRCVTYCAIYLPQFIGDFFALNLFIKKENH